MNSNKGVSQSADVSLRSASIVAGLGLLIMAVLAPIVQFGIFPKLIVAGNASTTTANIMASPGLFGTGIACFLIVAILDVVVAWALYVLFKPVNISISLLAAWFRVVYAAIFAVALISLVNSLQLLAGADYLRAFGADPLHAQVMLLLSAFKNGWDLGLAFFGLHLLILGYLVFKSDYSAKWLGILLGLLLAAAGLGYFVDSFGKLLLPSYSASIAQFTFFGEVLLIFWLFWKGIKGFDKKPEQN
jgi:hypothetical protein